eukprot:Cvel_19856.t1-p1 / transcript=Cvel_19856.t1 / gene=Cvel_19856 / organism=Chromera_velia_CCMP2878 / gene_product=Ultraviolet-B receptor UVR8, putative / transcript_product=Ultraviolet-B receptor UVR8, putative / location=Cvel_scaffold1739:34465-40070(+) / protein_length=454 / sequence_SO=supercontig / SO=protein_coding / is_pseudo=false
MKILIVEARSILPAVALHFFCLWRTGFALTASSSFSGTEHTGIIDSVGDLYTTGGNQYGQLGLGHTTDAVDFTKVTGLSNIASGCASDHTAVIDTSGNLWTWGRNNNGQLGAGDTTDRNSPASISISALVSVGCGEKHTIGLSTGGKILTWGAGGSGQLGHGNTNDETSPSQLGGSLNSKNFIKASAGQEHTGAVTDGGKLYMWGAGAVGQLGTGGTSNEDAPVEITVSGETFTDVALGQQFTLAVTSSGKLYSFGLNDRGQLGLGDTTDRNTPQLVISSGVSAVAAGKAHAAVVMSDGSVQVWGENTDGQLGLGDTTDRSSPTTLSGVTATAISAGTGWSIFIGSSGDVSGAGNNSGGQLGTGDTSSVSSPSASPTFSNLCAANERVVSSACTACPAGTTTAAGDDPSGSDTTCDATTCSANERVVSNACVACPAGTTNVAGDDASGSDTTCD